MLTVVGDATVTVTVVVTSGLPFAIGTGILNNGISGMSARRKNKTRRTLWFNPLATTPGSLSPDS